MIYLQVTEREARELIRGVQDTNPELARVLRKNVDRQTGFTHPRQTFALTSRNIPTEVMRQDDQC